MAFRNHTFTPAGKMQKASVQNIIDWIHEAWNEVKNITIQRSFEKCGNSNNMEGTEDDYLWDNMDSSDSTRDSEAASIISGED